MLRERKNSITFVIKIALWRKTYLLNLSPFNSGELDRLNLRFEKQILKDKVLFRISSTQKICLIFRYKVEIYQFIMLEG